MKKILTLVLAVLMILSLGACGMKGGSGTDNEPKNLDEAVTMYKDLMAQENEILSKNKKLWETVFIAADKGMTLQEDFKNYGDFLQDTIDSIKDKFSDDELKTLKSEAKKIQDIEKKLTKLEEMYPEVAEKAKEDSMKESGDGSMCVPADSVSANTKKFPSFTAKDLDGNKVDSSKLFAGNTVTVMNFWFTTCKPCVGELKDLEALNKKLAKKGGQVVGVNSFTLDGDKKAISEAKDILSKKGISYKNIWFKSDSDAGKFTSELYSYPTTFVIDKSGNIVGDPIVGAITSSDQMNALNKLIDKAMK